MKRNQLKEESQAKFALKKFKWDLIKGLLEINKDRVERYTSIKRFRDQIHVIY